MFGRWPEFPESPQTFPAGSPQDTVKWSLQPLQSLEALPGKG
jgi:hypothetical protein